MNNEEKLSAIESGLRIRLPEDYKSTLLDFPLTGDGEEPLLYEDLDLIYRVNREFRESGFRGNNWPESLFVIGGNRAGDVYFVDLARDDSPVFAITHEMEQFDPEEIDRFRQGFSFSSWVGELMSGQEWYREVRRKRATKKWWQFWI